MKKVLKKDARGFSVIEVLFFISIFMIASMAFYQTISSGIQVALDSKNRLGALALGNERLEIIRNMRYSDIGTTTGIPAGTLLASEDVFINNKAYRVTTFIKSEDDPFDGIYPTDNIPEDFKTVRINVSWGEELNSAKEVSLTARFAPPGLETETGDGVLGVNVINGIGVGVPQAKVHLVNNDVTPQVDITSFTNDEGKLNFPGAKQSVQKYQLTVSKDGYEEVSTIDPVIVAYNHIDVHASVIEGLLNTKSVVIDRLSNLTINTVDYAGGAVPEVDFHLKGGRILGTNNTVVPGALVYILDANKKTDSGGEISLNDHSPGQFFISSVESPSGYTFIGLNQADSFEAASNTYAFSLLPGTSREMRIKFAKNIEPSLLVKVTSSNDKLPISGAQVRLSNSTGYDVTVSTAVDGVAFFPIDGTSLIPENYQINISADGFAEESSSVEIDKLIVKEMELDAN